MRSQLFIASTPAVDRSAELSSPIAKENLLLRFIGSGEIPTSDPVRDEDEDEDEDEDSEDDEDNEDDKATDRGDRGDAKGRTIIPDSSPIVSRLTRYNQLPFIAGHQESITVPPTSSPAQLSAYASPSPALSSRPPSSPPRRTKPTHGDDDDMDIASDSDIDSDSNYEPTVTPAAPSTARGTRNSLEDELSASDAAFPCHRDRPSSSTPILKTMVSASSITPRSTSSPNPPLSASSKRKIERSTRRRAMGRKRAMLRKRSVAEIARHKQDEMSADELA
ncbi:unnamed protein product [Tuber aestivum]|uniref:Uncharacterized protein n=1 Tax=Tuber aestivum TaxID=59557 RepID=A0A292PXJ7_9PEZI|nr:unnamed protein product [Tuber aestivum]